MISAFSSCCVSWWVVLFLPGSVSGLAGRGVGRNDMELSCGEDLDHLSYRNRHAIFQINAGNRRTPESVQETGSADRTKVPQRARCNAFDAYIVKSSYTLDEVMIGRPSVSPGK